MLENMSIVSFGDNMSQNSLTFRQPEVFILKLSECLPGRNGVSIKRIGNIAKLYRCSSLGSNIINLMIYCHGSYSTNSSYEPMKWFTVPLWCTLFFYCPHGQVLKACPLNCLTGRSTPLRHMYQGHRLLTMSCFPKLRMEVE